MPDRGRCLGSHPPQQHPAAWDAPVSELVLVDHPLMLTGRRVGAEEKATHASGSRCSLNSIKA